ncbi:hypothetical protein [Leptospira borgpetersenii]|uniref:Uncharacterized protein n=2 Tax=Leptospira borgpetersenii serovar Hardjo-bovis TaxID=338217 RepID=Q04NR9_LEPBJ|nr:hypothetical protein [Leptospira borgpetersenii]ABJ77451.1 Hypothetical protein LBJ_4050 [Leptospira borgpetersenii serovar Hardjo-bovis str. JB197]ABJ80389.1 Hypothetical protein LBL_4050 [Leptospira borgpetersenii serovar Hardjo-bovis str. L550]AMX59831.1 hypothetical protein LBK6_16360 [Leptospira borgpetersenii serovar Hardjo]AMX63060.1 hypothetical protein LBK9_16290 [Leptospira borgpetersenii serovar Hardjo]AMX66303.1 hypothetical protein LBK30_16280 [Leptospira borgpetersenii serovar
MEFRSRSDTYSVRFMDRLRIQLLLVLFLFGKNILFAQSVQAPVSGLEEIEDVHKKNAATLDKEYYEYYFRTVPDVDALEKAKLEYNLIRSFKLELRRREPSLSPDYLKQIKATSIRYERVLADSIWMRGIRNQMQHIRFQEYMYIVIYDKYFLYISYEMNPLRYVMEPYQVQLIFQKENPFFIKLPDP